MIAIGKSKWSDLCRDTFKTDLKAIDVSQNKYYIARQWINEGDSPKEIEECEKKLDELVEYLKSKNLKVLYFGFAFNKKLQKYVYQYIVRSKIHSNPDLQIDGVIDGNVLPYSFFPGMFSSYFTNILDEVPYSILEQVARGE